MLSDGWNYGGTIETGYTLNLGKRHVIEPQMQLTWQRYETGPATDVYERNYTWDDADSLRARAGLRWGLAHDPRKEKALLPWLRVSALHEYRGDYALHVKGHRDRVYTYDTDLGGASYRFDGGLLYVIGKSASLGLSAAWRTGDVEDGFSVQASAQLAW